MAFRGQEKDSALGCHLSHEFLVIRESTRVVGQMPTTQRGVFFPELRLSPWWGFSLVVFSFPTRMIKGNARVGKEKTTKTPPSRTCLSFFFINGQKR